MITEDWEKIMALERVYVLESQMAEEESNWRQWLEEREKQLPAEIVVNIPKLQENEDYSIPFF